MSSYYTNGNRLCIIHTLYLETTYGRNTPILYQYARLNVNNAKVTRYGACEFYGQTAWWHRLVCAVTDD